MDKNTTTGLLLIGAILLGFSYFTSPSDSEIKELQRIEDSVKLSKVKPLAAELKKNDSVAIAAVVEQETAGKSIFKSDSSIQQETFVVENELLKLTISNKGAQIKSAELKDYKTYDGKPLNLLNNKSNSFGFSLPTQQEMLTTSSRLFTRSSDVSDKSKISFRLAVSGTQYIEYTYKLSPKSYMVDLDVNMVGLQSILKSGSSTVDFKWDAILLQTEKDYKTELQYSGIYYRTSEGDIDNLPVAEDKKESPAEVMKWVSFKQHFFTTTLIAKDKIQKSELETSTAIEPGSIKRMTANLKFPLTAAANQTIGLQMYIGPNKYYTLNNYDLDLEKQINLGWGPLKYINRYAVLPVFSFLSGFNLNYGIIILVLTILLKVVLLPLTFKSYMSTAKMKVLKPEMDEIKAKLGEDDPTRLQQEYLKLYKKAGVNPLGGCLPLLLQMPILIAFFNFFPTSIELRQQGFLWVNDLSTYDSIWDFGQVPIVDFVYGNHVSLMCLLMTASTLLYTRMNNQISGATGQMKWMGYIMPVMFMGFLNSVSSGLNYYYFCANMITFGQQYFIRKFVDEDKLHAQIQENKKKPEGKKSTFQTKLEEITKAQQQRKARETKKIKQ